MTLKEYQKQAQRTYPSLGDTKLDLCHMVLGIFSEFEEYYSALGDNDKVGISEECSDTMWYLANYCTMRKYDLQMLFNKRVFNDKPFIVNVSILQDIIKKHVAYNKPIDVLREQETLTNILYNLSIMYQDINIHESLDKNIAKLRQRFPEKFTEKNALNRDLDAERKILEG